MAKDVVKCTFFVVFSIYVCLQTTKAGDSLKPGDKLNASSSLCSATGMSCLEFRSYGGRTYLVILIQNNWTWSWLANRDEPILNKFAQLSLTLDHSGVLKIIQQDGKPIILYNASSSATNINTTTIAARLLDSGNFMVQDESKGSVLWQSFDYPVHELISGMKLGVNHKTGHTWSVVSSLTEDISASGALTLEWEPKRRELMIRRRGQLMWASGVLGKNDRFEHIPEQVQSMFQYTVIKDETEESFSFTTASNYTAWHLWTNGKLTARASEKHIVIVRADECDGINTDAGCHAWMLDQNLPTCRHRGQTFEFIYGRFLFNNSDSDYPDKAVMYDDNTSISGIDCWNSCWSNCDCVGFTVNNFSSSTGCVYFYGNLWQSIAADSYEINDHHTYGLYHLKMPSDHKGTKKWTWKSTVILIASVLLILFPSTLYLAFKIRKAVLKERKRKRLETELLDLDASTGSSTVTGLVDDITKKEQNLRVFTYASITAATNGFSLDNKLGEGGFGPVYKGTLPTGKEVAVKRLSKTSRQGVVEFKNELTLICELQHMNLVQLLGCCIHGQERILIYEYMPNKSLDFFLFDMGAMERRCGSTIDGSNTKGLICSR